MSNGAKVCIPPLSEICAIIGSKALDKSAKTGNDTSDIIENSIPPGILLSVITSEKVVKDFQDDPDLCITSSISWSVLKNLPMFCFPHGTQLSSKIPEIKIEYGIFTDETGSRLYMYCLCFPMKIQIPNQSSDGSMFSITKLCFFSSHKCFILMKDIFQTLSSQLKDSDLIETEVKNLLVILSKVFVPPKGTLDVSFGYKDKSFTLHCQVVAGFSDAPLSLPFMFFDHKTVIEIIVAIISEQRVVFVSNDPSNRVLIMECFLSCIFPFEWLAPYFPLLTENLYDLLDAMGYFIFGADRSVLEEDHDERRIIFIDIDNGTINYCDGATRFNFDPTVVARLKERLPRTSFNFLCSTINKIFESEKVFTEAKEEFDFLLNVRIFLSVQYVLIDLYKGLLTFQMSAKKKMSINKQTECAGYHLTPLQMHLKDTMMRSNLRLKYNNPYLERQCFALLDVLKKRPIEHVLDEVKLNKRCNELITFTSSIDDNLKSVELKLTTSDSLSDKSSLLYLRALLLLNNEEPILAFQSINKIFEAGVKNFPAVEVMALLKKLEHFPNLYNEVMKQNFMQQAVWAPLTMELGPENIMKSQLSDRNYNYLEFPELMLEMGITRNHETARQIFTALKSDSDHVLGQDAKNFCEIWGGLRKYLDRRIYLPIITNKSEKLVKYSEQDTKADTGMYLVGSIYKLYFVDIATLQVCDFMNIDEITDIRVSKPCQIRFQLRSRNPKQIENIKDASRWILILEELIGATHIFKKTKDQSILVDARAGILIFDSLHQYESKYGELLDMSDYIVEEDGSSSNFFIEKVKHSRFLTYHKKLKMSCSPSRSISTISNVCGIDNIFCKFSPNPKIKETIEVLVGDLQYLYIGTRTCSLHKVSMSTFDVEAHISMMLPDNENWTLYDILLIEDNLWIAVKYKSLSRSLHIMKCGSFDNYQTLPLFHHNDHIVCMKRIGELCFITSMDGLTSIWSIETKSITHSVQDCQSYIFTAQIRGNNLLQSVKNGFSVYSESEFALHKTGFTLSKFIVCEELGHIYGIDKAAPDTIRCFSSYSFVHLEDLDICNTIEAVDQKSFYNLVLHGDNHLVLTTRNCSLIVYNLSSRCFERSVPDAHMDLISCIITTDDDKIITGSRSLDGTVTVWIDMFD